MNLFGWREKSWRQRALLLATAAVVILLAAHPELRLFVPMVDMLGLDLVCLLVGSQLLEALRPTFLEAYRLCTPTAVQLYFLVIFFLGYVGPQLDVQLRRAIAARG